MPNHILDKQDPLDGKRKYLGTVAGEDFYLRVVTSGDEAKKYPEAIEAMSKLEEDALIEQQKKDPTRTVKDLHFTWDKEIISGYFNKETGWFFTDSFKANNRAMFVVENDAGKFASVILVDFNDASLRKNFHVPEEIKSFVFFDSIVTAEEYRGKGLFATAFDKIITMVTNPKRGLEAPFHFMVSVMAANAITADGAELNYALNLPAYAAMWNERFTDNTLQNRWVKGYSTITGKEHLAISNFTKKDSDRFEIDESKVNDLLQEQKETAHYSRGVFLSGNIHDSANGTTSYDQAKQRRKDLLQRRGAEKLEAKKGSWTAFVSTNNEKEKDEQTR